ncbi:hypothetical protein O181_104799 [Austropuccinia psidii MF-1]|uniref:Uncharacterized protein n=1 Tax=Austropuccinia psidii MF-1 TaxID=1389203 RepID=A0A9Q3PKI0_9BASI|nr:hypothetical protein [Austropuccinia psidii MF-1]
MAPIQHINPLLFITDTLTESDTSAPNSDTPNLTSSDSGLGQRARSHVGNSGLYQAMLSDDESSGEYEDGDEDYVVAEDDVTPPKRARTSVKRRRVRSNVYDYFEKLNPNGEWIESKGNFRFTYKCCHCSVKLAIRPTSTNTEVDLAAEEQESVLKQLVEGLVAIQVSFSIFESPRLRSVLQRLAPNFSWPKRRLVAQTASQLYFKRKNRLLQEVDNLPSDTPLCGAIDCWTTKDQSESYLAIVLQWINPVNYSFRKSIVAFEVICENLHAWPYASFRTDVNHSRFTGLSLDPVGGFVRTGND